MKNKFILWVLLLFCCSCIHNQNNEKEMKIISVPIDTPKENYEMTDVDSIVFIPLSTSEECLLGNIISLKYKNNRFYLLDDFRKSIYIFNNDGSFWKKIEQIGNGPGEYTEITDFSLSTNQMTILDNIQQRLHFFDLDGTYLNSFSISRNGWANYCVYAGDRLFMINEWSNSDAGYYHLFAYSTDGFKKYLPFTKKDTERMGGYFCMSERQDSLLVHFSTTDALYRLTSTGCSLEYKIDYQGKNLPDEYKLDDLITLLKKGIARDYVLGLDELGEDCKNIYLMFSFKDDQYVAVYDKKAGTCSLYDWFSCNDLSFSRLRVTDDYYITNLSAQLFIVHYQYIWKEGMKDKKLLGRIEKIATEITPEDNGVILLFHRKK